MILSRTNDGDSEVPPSHLTESLVRTHNNQFLSGLIQVMACVTSSYSLRQEYQSPADYGAVHVGDTCTSSSLLRLVEQ